MLPYVLRLKPHLLVFRDGCSSEVYVPTHTQRKRIVEEGVGGARERERERARARKERDTERKQREKETATEREPSEKERDREIDIKEKLVSNGSSCATNWGCRHLRGAAGPLRAL